MEKRAFITEEQYEKVVEFLNTESEKKETENQIIYVYHTEGNFRLIRTNDYMHLTLKADNINDSENNVYISPDYAHELINMFLNLGISVEVKRYRVRNKFFYKELYLTVDKNIKYGNVIRAKGSEAEIDVLFNNFNIVKSDIEKYNIMYTEYRTNWRDLIKNVDEKEFLG